jgi:hypothetical protein
MTLQDDFLIEVRAFLISQAMGASAFGLEAMNDPNFVFDLDRGRSVRLDTVEKVRRFMTRHANGSATTPAMAPPPIAGASAAPSSPTSARGRHLVRGTDNNPQVETDDR